MRQRNILFRFLLIPVLFVLSPSMVSAMDTDLYAVTGVEVPPNLLIILDNSSSMTTEDQPPLYNPTPPNAPPSYDGPYVKDGVYSKQGSDWVYWKNMSEIDCNQAKLDLGSYGLWNGKMKSDATCGGNKNMFLQTGNYMNYLVWTTTSNQPRLGLAKGVLHSYINSTEGIRFGLGVFNANGQGGRITSPVSDNKQTLFNALNDIQPSNVVDWTPLAETLYETMLYFKGGASYYNQWVAYTSPIQYYCQKNYVILITDGAPTYDVADDNNSPIPGVIGDYDADGLDAGIYGDPVLKGSHYLDDVAKYVHEKDLRSDLGGRQNITVYTIGFNPSPFAIDSTLLQSTASKGGGKYFYCHNAQSFAIAFQLIIEEILNKSTSFLAPTVPISQLEKTTSGDRMYLGMFKPTERSFWKGNIKKYGIATANSGGVTIGDVLDKNGNLATDPEINAIYDSAISYWSTEEDGGEVEKGGVGKLLRESLPASYDPSTIQNDRKIYTYLGTKAELTDSSNAFTEGNLSSATLGVSTEAERNKLVSFVYGFDAYDEDGDTVTTERRDWVLGAFIHSRPLILHYSDRSIIYAGSNDGMLHAFDADTGAEVWAFIPPDLLPRLKNLSGNTIQFFVDGSPKAYVASDKKILVCGERRGGNRYFALDVTNPIAPKWLWQIHPGMADYAEMGQSWSSPMIGKIKYGSGDKWVFFISGGYDTNQDDIPVTKDDTLGRAIYVVDAFNGSKIWKYTTANNDQMKYSIPSDITRIDTDSNGRIDRLYVGDMGGQVWRFDIGDPSSSNWTGKRIFNSNDPSPSSGVDRRKIFYPPDVSLEKDAYGDYEMVIFGTGDREHPKDTAVVERLYSVKDRNSGTVLTESNLVDVTEDLLQSGTASTSEKQTLLANLRSGSGWYIRLNQNSGEKCLAPPLIFYGATYFTTFTPLEDASSDPCFVGEGTARLYALNYLNGNAVFNFDLTNDLGNSETLGRSDRTFVVGTAIPSGAIIAIIGGTTASGYIGVGGGIYKAPLRNNKVILPVNWRQKF